MKRYLLAIIVLLGFSVFGRPALADTWGGVECDNNISALSPNYPNNGNFWICFNTKTPTNKPTLQQANLVVGAASQANGTTGGLLAKQNVLYYLFANRADANNFMKSDPGFFNISSYQSSMARCGNTGAKPSGASPIVEIYNTCSFSDGTTPVNPSLGDVTLHESGHAYDFALDQADNNGSITPSTSYGFKYLLTGSQSQTAMSDLNYLTLGRNNQIPQTCSIFQSITPSNLEYDLGKANGAVQKPVCNTSGAVLAPFTTVKTYPNDTFIAELQDPYFLKANATGGNPYYEELFAESFAAYVGANSLPQIDYMIRNNYLICSFEVIQGYLQNNSPISRLGGIGCPIPTAAEFQRSTQ